MAAVTFPSTLPNPSASVVTPAERRLLSDVKGGPQQARGLQRDYLGTQEVAWNLLTPAEAAIFDDWWKTTLQFGGAWFASTWPAPQGFVSLVRRFMGDPSWTHVEGGFWRVSARMLVRGRGMEPTDCLVDTFNSGIGSYTLLSGSFAPFSNPPGVLRTTSTSSGDNVSRISRPVSGRQLSSAMLRFKLRSIGLDDACLAAVYGGDAVHASGNSALSLNPVREKFYDFTQSPHVYIGANDYQVGPGALSIGVNYEMAVTIPQAGNTTCVITNLDTDTIVQSTSLGVHARPTIDSLDFYVDEASSGKLCETDYYYIRVC
jgi:hypothetical protein